MKRNIFYIICMCFAAAVSCSEDGTDHVAKPESGTVELDIRPVYENADGTRVEYVDFAGLLWQSTDGEELTVLPTNGSILRSTAVTVGDDNSAEFAATVPADAGEVWFCYPYADGMALTDRDFDFPYETVQAEAGRAEGIFKLVSAESVTLTAEQIAAGAATVTPKFEVVGAILRFLVCSTDETLRDEKLVSVELEANADITGTCRHNFVTGERTVFAAAENARNAKVALGTPCPLNEAVSNATAHGVYIHIIPAETNGYSYTVTTDKHVYTFRSTRTFAFERNKLHNITLNLAKATSVLDLDRSTVTYNTANLPAEKEISSMSGRNVSVGYYIAMLDGEEDIADYDAEYYKNVSVVVRGADGSSVSWLTGRVGNNNWLYITYDENKAAEPRTAYVDMIYTPDEYQIAATPFATVAITQAAYANTHTLAYRWFGGGQYILSGDGEEKATSYFLAYLDGAAEFVPDSNADFYPTVRFDVESETEWLTVKRAGNNNITLSCFANPSTTDERKATVKAFFDGDKDTYLLDDPDAPLFSFEVTQAAGSEGLDVKTVYYDISPLNISRTWDSDAVASVDLGWFFAYEEGNDTRFENGRYFSNLNISSSAEWASATVAGNHIYLTLAKNTGDVREAVITAEYPVATDPSVTVRDSADGVAFTFTVSQASGLPKTVRYEWENGALIGSVHDATAETEWGMRFGTLWAYVDGERNTDTGSKYYGVQFDCGDAGGWLSGIMAWGSQIYARCTENTTGTLRQGVIRMYLPETESIEVEGGNTIAELFVLQYPADGNMFKFNFEYAVAPFKTLNTSAAAERADAGWTSIYIKDAEHDGTTRENDASELYGRIELTTDSDWLSAEVGGNHIYYNCTENTTGVARTGYIYGRLNIPTEYAGYICPDNAFIIKIVQAAQ